MQRTLAVCEKDDPRLICIGSKWIYIDIIDFNVLYGFTWIWKGFTWIYIYLYMDLDGISVIQELGCPAGCGGLWQQAVAPIQYHAERRGLAG